MESWLHLTKTSGTGNSTIGVTGDANEFIDRTTTIHVIGAGKDLSVQVLHEGRRMEFPCTDGKFKTSDGRIGFLKE